MKSIKIYASQVIKHITKLFLSIFARIISILTRIVSLDFELSIKHKMFQMFLIKNYSSNHPRRLLLSRRFISNNFTESSSSLDKKIDHQFLNHKTILISKEEILLVYVGDSLIEYLSRVMINCNNYKNALAFWLGPKTRLGLTLRRNELYSSTYQDFYK